MAYVDQPEDLISRIQRMENEIRDLRRLVGVKSGKISNAVLDLRDNSRLQIVDAGGDLIAKLGSLGYSYDDGAPQQGVELRFEDGSAALTVWNPFAHTTADRQYVALWNGGAVIVSSDATSGFGLARPWLPIAFQRADVASWASTTSAAYVALVESWTHQQHPWFEARIAVSGNSGSTGDARILVDGVPIGDPVVFDGTNASVQVRSARLVGPFGAQRQVVLEVRRNTGAGTIFAKVDAWWRQS